MPRLIMMSGPSGSGKSTKARQMLAEDGNMVRLNRDELRLMALHKWTPRREEFIKGFEDACVIEQAKHKTHIIIDDTNLTERDEKWWREMARKIGYDFQKIAVNPGIEECVARDNMRRGESHVGRAVIERQFLRGKLIQWPTDRKVVIFDIDGTLADLTHRTPWLKVGGKCPNCGGEGLFRVTVDKVDYSTTPATCSYITRDCACCNGTGKLAKKQHDIFYSLVERDTPIDIVVRWAQATAKDYMNVIVSGRSPEKAEQGTLNWLEQHKVPYEHIFMRRANMHGEDTVEKQLILTMMLESGLSRDQIAFVVDDRPSVVQMWRDNGIKVFPVRGRDDDEFYNLMNDLEKTHPRPELGVGNE